MRKGKHLTAIDLNLWLVATTARLVPIDSTY